MKNSFIEKSKNISDEELIKQINEGCYECLHILIMRYTPLVKYYAQKQSFNHNITEDLVQEGIIALYSAVKNFDAEKSSFSTFASLCINRVMLTHKQAEARKKRVPQELCSSFDEFSEIIGAKSAENEFLEKESLKILTDNIKLELSGFEYNVLSGFLSDMSYSDIAENNGVTIKSVDNALKRIRSKLKSKNV